MTNHADSGPDAAGASDPAAPENGAEQAANTPDSGASGSAAQDSAAQDSAAQDSAAQDSAAQDSAAQGSAVQDSGAPSSLEDRAVEVIKTIYDPEIPVDIHELGLIYDILPGDDELLTIRMTLTSPNCPAAESLPAEVETKLMALDGVSKVEVDIVWDPTWTPELMSEAAKLELGMW